METKEMRVCNCCDIEKPLTDFRKYSKSPDGRGKKCKTCAYEKDKEARRRYNNANPETSRKIDRDSRARVRQRVLDKFGGKCGRCGFSDSRALQVDHVNGGGKRELKNVTRAAYLKKVLSDTTDTYQLLCANCNWIKRYENNEIKIK